MTPGVHRAGLAGAAPVANRQQLAPITWVDNYCFAPGNPGYTASNMAALDGVSFVSGPLTSTSPLLCATIDFGSPKLIQDVQIGNYSGYDYFGSGAVVGVNLQIWDDAGLVVGSIAENATGSGALATFNRVTRYLYLYGARRGGYGSDPTGTYTTIFYLNNIIVTGEV